VLVLVAGLGLVAVLLGSELDQPYAQRALGIAKTLGYDKAVVLGGGMGAWKEANLPLEKA